MRTVATDEGLSGRESQTVSVETPVSRVLVQNKNVF